MTKITRFEDYHDDRDNDDVMMAEDYETDELHPLMQDLQEGGVILEGEVIDTFIDDHEPCFIVRVRTELDNYVVSLMYTCPSALVEMAQAVNDKDKSLAWKVSLTSPS
jgi:hypothetical protein